MVQKGPPAALNRILGVLFNSVGCGNSGTFKGSKAVHRTEVLRKGGFSTRISYRYSEGLGFCLISRQRSDRYVCRDGSIL